MQVGCREIWFATPYLYITGSLQDSINKYRGPGYKSREPPLHIHVNRHHLDDLGIPYLQLALVFRIRFVNKLKNRKSMRGLTVTHALLVFKYRLKLIALIIEYIVIECFFDVCNGKPAK